MSQCINLHKVPVKFRIFTHYFAPPVAPFMLHERIPNGLPHGFAAESHSRLGVLPCEWIPNGLQRGFGAESYLASPSTVAKRLGVLPYLYINRPGGVRPPRENQLLQMLGLTLRNSHQCILLLNQSLIGSARTPRKSLWPQAGQLVSRRRGVV